MAIKSDLLVLERIWVQIPALMYKVSDLGISASTDRYPQQKQGLPGPWASWLAGVARISELWDQQEALALVNKGKIN